MKPPISTEYRSIAAGCAEAFPITQSLNQIDNAYGQNHSILDNHYVRITFATNDERTAKRISEALGVTIELRAQRNYAGHRLAPWIGCLMVLRQETVRPLLTPGEVMQLPPDDGIRAAALPTLSSPVFVSLRRHVFLRTILGSNNGRPAQTVVIHYDHSQ